MRFAELFAGAGGFGMGFLRAGWECAWHAEIAPHPRIVLEHRWPDVPLYGDVMALDGRELVARHGAVDAVIGGSPCQDLSVAGRRGGLDGARSSLFYQLMRLWDETGADLCLWENVDGARSSNAGKDFGAVLGAFVGATVPVPADGWRSAGWAAGPTGVAAWRILDAQYFGVPQRRRRVFVLGTRGGSVDPAEVLSLAESVRGDSAPRREAGEGTAARAGGGVASESGQGWWDAGSSVAPLRADPGGMPSHIAFHQTQDPISEAECSPALGATSIGMGVLAFSAKDAGQDAGEVAPTLRAGTHRDSHENGGVMPAICLTGEVTHALTHEGADASEDGTGRGTPITYTPDTARCDTTRGGQRHAEDQETYVAHGIPRRLTPRECERLMGWPDDHTLVPLPNGKPMSDAARYRMCGNGVATPVAHWIAERLALALDGAA